MDFIQQFGSHWLWFAFSGVLLILEIFFGSFRFMAASIAAIVVGVLSHLFPYVGVSIELLFFVVLASTCIWLANSFVKEHKQKTEHLKRIYREQAYVGQEYTLDTPMSNGQGNISLDGVTWQLRGPDCDKGQTIRVLEMGQGMLRVEPVGA